jgi:hypothetical protein
VDDDDEIETDARKVRILKVYLHNRWGVRR